MKHDASRTRAEEAAARAERSRLITDLIEENPELLERLAR
ncbi:hypothetical protein CELL_01974 [Cellulomonas sp. T2.31MG-18]